MSKRLKDFIELFLFGFVIFTFGLVVIQFFTNFFKFVFYGDMFSLDFNMRFFFSFEILIVTLCSILGLIYVYWFKKYKKEPDDK